MCGHSRSSVPCRTRCRPPRGSDQAVRTGYRWPDAVETGGLRPRHGCRAVLKPRGCFCGRIEAEEGLSDLLGFRLLNPESESCGVWYHGADDADPCPGDARLRVTGSPQQPEVELQGFGFGNGMGMKQIRPGLVGRDDGKAAQQCKAFVGAAAWLCLGPHLMPLHAPPALLSVVPALSQREPGQSPCQSETQLVTNLRHGLVADQREDDNGQGGKNALQTPICQTATNG
ncbi:hypothetical protein NKDENANG_03925 [Candidatus Entotheonellaceae bacterium PAL068K]